MNWQRLYLLAAALVLTCVVAGIVAVVLGGYYERKSHAGQEVSSFDELSLERTSCFGSCPRYRVSVLATGEVRFDGLEWVEVKGLARGQLDDAQMRQLLSAIKNADFFALRDTYVNELDGCPVLASDSSTVTTSVRVAGQTKTVRHYLGCLEWNHDDLSLGRPFPPRLTDLENSIDTIIGTDRWIEGDRRIRPAK